MVIGSSREDEFDKEYTQKFLNNGRKKIAEYPTLNTLVDNFRQFDQTNYSANPFLNLASVAEYDVFSNGPDKNANALLGAFEKIIVELKIQDWKAEIRSNFENKIKSFQEGQAESIFTELEFYRQLKLITTVINLQYGIFTDSNHDFRFTLNDQEFNAELTEINAGKVEQILKEALNFVAKELNKSIPENMLLKIDIRADEVLDKDGNNTPKKIQETLLPKLLIALPLIKASPERIFFLHPLGGELEKTLYEQLDILQYYPDLKDSLDNLKQTPEGIEYLKTIKIKDLKINPLSSSIYVPGKAKRVEIHTQQMWPSPAESARQQSLIRQICRALKDKLGKNQLAGQPNPLIVIHVTDYLLHEDIGIGEETLTIIKEKIQRVFKESNNTEILGCLLWIKNIQSAPLIKNPLSKNPYNNQTLFTN